MSDPLKGRGAAGNPGNRFERLAYEPLPMVESPDRPETQFFADRTRSFITYNDSPDVGFDASINPYRGCEHGCIYCYARPYHEYLGFSAGLDFETRILVKEDGPEILRRELAAPSWKPQTLALSGVTDAYQPIERRLELTRRCLEVLVEFRNPVGVVTKNRLVTRDIDLLGELARNQACGVLIAVTTLDSVLAQRMEPRASAPAARLEAIRELAAAGIPVGVLVAPTIPGLTDHEMPAILEAARDAGASFAGFVVLRLPHGLGDLFQEWLDRHYPEKKDRVLQRIRAFRGGKLNETRFGDRMRGEGVLADLVREMFAKTTRRLDLGRIPSLSTAAFRREGSQPTLF